MEAWISRHVELYCITSTTRIYNYLPQGHREELVKALPKELVKAPPRAYLVSDTQVTQKRVLIGVVRATWSTATATATRRRRDGDATAMRRRLDGLTRWKHG